MTVARRGICVWSVLAFLFAGAAGGRAQTAPAVAHPRMLVTTAWLAQHLNDPNVVIIHTDPSRTEYDGSHIPGAVFLSTSDYVVDGETHVGYELPPVAAIVQTLERAGVADGRRIVVYSRNPLAATRLWLTLDYISKGDDASILDGGLQRWIAEKRPLTQALPEVDTGRLTGSTRPGMLVDAEYIKGRLSDTSTLLLDARPDDEYTGADGGMGGMAHPGHIPGAVQLYWEQLVHSQKDDPGFLAPDALHAKFAGAGADKAKTVVAYCMIGARASLDYFVGRMLGYDMKFYDGSWHDWGTRDLPYVQGRSPR